MTSIPAAAPSASAVPTARLDSLLARMAVLLESLRGTEDPRRYFVAVYRRTTEAVAEAIASGHFDDNAWLEEWDVVFANLGLDALESDAPPRPWQQARSAGPDLPPLRHVLLGINAHINYDLPQALLAVITDKEFDDHRLMARRRADHERIDALLASRVGDEDAELAATGRSTTDRLLAPLTRWATRRVLREARTKVWDNAVALSCARRQGRYPERLAELEELSAARVADLMRPGQVLLRLAREGFGVRLDPRDPMRSYDPVRLGLAERDGWAAYYRHEWLTALRAFLVMVREGFGMPPMATLRGAWWVLRANQLWAPFPDNDPDGARAAMTRFYSLVAHVHGLAIDPTTAVRLEVDWWRAHREAQHDPSVGHDDLVEALTTLYAHVYAVEPDRVREAARLRAAAMRVSDAWVAAGCEAESLDLVEEGDLLVDSYGSLLAAVRCR